MNGISTRKALILLLAGVLLTSAWVQAVPPADISQVTFVADRDAETSIAINPAACER